MQRSCLVLSAAQAFQVNGHTIHLRQHFFDNFVRQPQARHAADRTGLKLWPCSRPTLEHLNATVLPILRRHVVDNRPLRVLELGSGVGFLGIAVAALGPSVVLTDPDVPVNFSDDHMSSTLSWLRANVVLNKESVCGQMSVQRLCWGNADHIAKLKGHNSAEFGGVLDNDCKNEGFDLVLGSELLYNTDSYVDLLDTFRAFAPKTAPTGTIVGVLSFTKRHSREGLFFEMARPYFESTITSVGKVQIAELRTL